MRTVTTAMAVEMTGYSEARLRQLAAEGLFPKAVRGQYELQPLIHGVIKHIEAQAARAAARSHAPLIDARRREIELRLEQQLTGLVDTCDLIGVFQHVRLGTEEEFAAIEFGPEVPPEVAAAARAAHRAAFARLDRRFEVALRALRTGRDPFEALDSSRKGHPHD